MAVSVRTLTPETGLAGHLDGLAALRIRVFHDWPYIYDGNQEEERKYLAAFAASAGAVCIAAFDGGKAGRTDFREAGALAQDEKRFGACARLDPSATFAGPHDVERRGYTIRLHAGPCQHCHTGELVLGRPARAGVYDVREDVALGIEVEIAVVTGGGNRLAGQ